MLDLSQVEIPEVRRVIEILSPCVEKVFYNPYRIWQADGDGIPACEGDAWVKIENGVRVQMLSRALFNGRWSEARRLADKVVQENRGGTHSVAMGFPASKSALWVQETTKVSKWEPDGSPLRPRKNSLAPFIIRALDTGWGNSHKAGDEVSRLRFEFSVKGMSRVRCATLSGSSLYVGLGVAYKEDAFLKGFTKDVCSYPTGRRKTSRTCRSRRTVSLADLRNRLNPDTYPEIYVRPGARPVAIIWGKSYGYIPTEVRELAEELGVPIWNSDGEEVI